MIRRLGLWLLLAIAAAGFLRWAYPRVDRSSLWQLRITRESGLERARALAQAHGIPAQTWPGYVRASASLWLNEWQHRNPNDPVCALEPPWTLSALFRDPRQERFLEVKLRPDGGLREWREVWRNPPPKKRTRSDSDITAEATRWFQELTGPSAERFQAVNRAVRQGREEHFTWEWRDPAVSPHVARVEVVFEGDRLTAAQLNVTGARAFTEAVRANQTWQGGAFALVMVLVTLVCFIANPVFFRALVRGRLRTRSLLTCGGLLTGLWLLTALGGSWWDDRMAAAAEAFTPVSASVFGTLLAWSLLLALMTVMYGAGRVLIEGEDHARWIGWEHLLRGDWRSQRLGAEIAAGLCGGVVTLAAVIMIAAFGLTREMTYASSSDFAAFRVLAIWPIRQFTIFLPAGLWLAVWPLAQRWRWGPALIGRILFFLAGALTLGIGQSFFDFGLGASLLAGLLMTVVMWQLYEQFGLLAALVSNIALFAAAGAATAWLQPSPDWTAAGWRVAITYGGIALVGALLAWRGRAVDETAETERLVAEVTSQTTGDRDRLTAEFEVARRAQRGMLPAVPPRLGEIDLAATCQPAREVGGDLYDFFPMGGSRYGVCVADVSGKGVPASLYMSLTKGYLAAAGPEESDLKSTLTDLNTHLHAAGKKRVFVTMALGILDVDAHTLDLARAGHNAILWRRRHRSESRFVQPKGLGLGITTRLLFERNLEITRLDIEPGDVVVLYSDGVPEAMNLDKQQYGEDRLTQVVERCDGLDAEQIQAEILRDLHHFIGAAPPHDDITLLVLRRRENGHG